MTGTLKNSNKLASKIVVTAVRLFVLGNNYRLRKQSSNFMTSTLSVRRCAVL
jgi:hypothetical protein